MKLIKYRKRKWLVDEGLSLNFYPIMLSLSTVLRLPKNNEEIASSDRIY